MLSTRPHSPAASRTSRSGRCEPEARVYAAEGRYQSGDYSRGTSYLDQGRYDQAVQAFDKVIAANDKRADGAMYWKAYALNRLGRGGEALSTLDELLKKFPSSRWANDAKALQVEVKQASGRPVNPSQQSDDELEVDRAQRPDVAGSGARPSRWSSRSSPGRHRRG